MKKLDLMQYRTILKTKGQFVAIISVLFVGIFVFTALNIAAKNLQDTLDFYYEKNNFADITIELVKIPVNAINKVKNKYNYRMATGRVVADVPFITDNKNERVNVRVISTEKNEDIVNLLHIHEGQYIKDKAKDALLIKKFAVARNIKIGDKIKVQLGGKQYTLNVKGIVDSPEFIYIMENEQTMLPDDKKFGVVYISDELARQSMGLSGSYNQLLIKLNKDQHIDDEEEKIKENLKKYGVKRIIKKENHLSNRMISEELIQLNKMSTSVPMLFLIIAICIIIMMTGRMVKKDRVYIGIMKALGYTNTEVFAYYARYALSIGVLGGVLGSSAGMLMSRGLTIMYMTFYNMPTIQMTFYPEYVIVGILMSCTFTLIAAAWGARGITKISPAEAMKVEAPKTNKKILLEKFKPIWNFISFDMKLILKNIFRNKKRLSFIISGIGLTFGLMILVSYMGGYFTDMFYDHYGNFMRMEYNINFTKPINQDVIKEFRNLIKIDYIEPKIEFPFEIINGKKKEIVNVIALKKDTKFYRFIDENGMHINKLDKGLYMSQNLANMLKVKKGDKVKIHSFIPDRDDFYINVAGIVKQGLGINAYIDIDTMATYMLDKEMATGVYINSKDNVNKKLDNVSNISSIQSLNDLIKVFEQFLAMTMFSVGILVVFAGVLGFTIIYNVSVISIGERERELATMRVLGYTKNEISGSIVKENIIMTVLGLLIGLPLGIWMIQGTAASFSNELYTLEPVVKLSYILQALIYTIIFIVIGQYSTYKKIRRLHLLDALKIRE